MSFNPSLVEVLPILRTHARMYECMDAHARTHTHRLSLSLLCAVCVREGVSVAELVARLVTDLWDRDRLRTKSEGHFMFHVASLPSEFAWLI